MPDGTSLNVSRPDLLPFAEWLSKQGDRRYDYIDCNECLLAQYARDTGGRYDEPANVAGPFDLIKDIPLPVLMEFIAAVGRETVREARKRTEAILNADPFDIARSVLVE